MENIQEYLESGILELYVCGALSEAESEEVTRMLKKYPEVKEEVEQIENSLQDLSGAAAPYEPKLLLLSLKKKIARTTVTKRSSRKNWPAIAGWAASIIFLCGLFFLYQVNHSLREDITALQVEQAILEAQIIAAREDTEKTEELLEALRSRNIERVQLSGQDFDPDAYATAYWNRENDIAYIDVQGLPAPPPGMVYQVWSLKLDPLTPSSIGVLENFEENSNSIFILENNYASEAFGITLEPYGGSEFPTLERLVVLGQVSTS